MNVANHELREIRVMMGNAGRTYGLCWLWRAFICVQLNIYRMTITAADAAVNTEVMRQILVNSFQLQSQGSREELSNLGKVLRFRGFASSKST